MYLILKAFQILSAVLCADPALLETTIFSTVRVR
jgi:hypothetical protein